MTRKNGAKNQADGPRVDHSPSRLLLWIAAAALTATGAALFVLGLVRQGLLGAVFYLIVVAMGLYLFTIPWRNRRAQSKAGNSNEE